MGTIDKVELELANSRPMGINANGDCCLQPTAFRSFFKIQGQVKNENIWK